MDVQKKRQRALLLASYTGAKGRVVCEEHLEELERLADTYGVETVLKIPCALRKIDASTFFGKGKLAEVLLAADEHQIDCIIVDEEIAPSQQRNLERYFKRTVLDRTEVILGVFAQRAQTKEARLQVELAQVKYQLPRLKRLWTHLSRQAGTVGGGGAYLKGEGEKQIELDRRLLEKRIDLLKDEIAAVRVYRETQRQARRRTGIPVFAIIGYTNAGKSTLLNALTEAGVFTEDKLFATLDTTTRKYTLSNNQQILLIDTVGLIRKLPHLLVAAFKSTLEESLQADVLLHIVDASHPAAEEQAATTLEVLQELGAVGQPVITVLNKIDRPQAKDMALRLRLHYPKSVSISATEREGFEALEEAMMRELSSQRRILKLRIPQSDYSAVAEVLREGIILQQEYVDDAVEIRAEVPLLLGEKLEKYAFASP